MWPAALGRQQQEFEPLLKEGRATSTLTVAQDEAGFKNVVMMLPQDTERHNKVMVVMFPVTLDPDDLDEVTPGQE